MAEKNGFGMRAATPDEAEALRGLTLRARAGWGYSTEAMALWQRAFSLSACYIATNDVWVVQVGNRIAGYFALERKGYPVKLEEGGWLPPALWLDCLYVEPAFARCGIGALLYHLALGLAMKHGDARLYVASDPHASGFFGRMAAVPAGSFFSPGEGRAVPVYSAAVPVAANSAG